MGIFSRKKKTTITGIVQPMLEAKDFVYSSKQAINEWIWDSGKSLGVNLDDKDIADYIIDYHDRTLPRQFNRLYNYTKKPNKYIFGLPTSAISMQPENDLLNQASKHIKNSYTNQTVNILHTYVGDKDYYITAWERLVKDFGYDSGDNSIGLFSGINGTKSYLYDGVLHITQRSVDEYQELVNPSLALSFHKCFDRPLDITRQQTPHQIYHKEFMAIEYVFGDDIHACFAIDLSDVNPEIKTGQVIPKEQDYVYLTYQADDSYHWFVYVYGSGLIPSIDTAINAKVTAGEYYPRLYTRLNQIDMVNTHESQKKKDTQKAFKKLGLNIADITKQLYKSIGESNYGDVRAMFIFMGIPINSIGGDNILAEYCHRYFKRLLDLSDKVTTNTSVVRAVGGLQAVADNYSTQIIRYDGIEFEELSTNVIDGDITIKPKTYATYKSDINGLVTHNITYAESQSKAYRISIINLSVTTSIGGYSFTKFGFDKELVIPLDRVLIRELSNKEKEYVMHRSLHITILHVKVTKQKWYETLGFKLLITAIAIAITYVSGGTATPTMASFLKAVAVGTAKAIALNMAVTLALKVAVEAGIIDPKTAVILGAIASIAIGLYGANGFDFSKILTATNVMKVVNASFNAYGKILQMQAQDSLKQIQQLQLDYTNQQAYINQAQKLLDTKVFDLNQEMLRSGFIPTVNLFETPEMFYSRHYNYDVIGLTHGLISNFVDGSLANKQVYVIRDEPVENVLLIE